MAQRKLARKAATQRRTNRNHLRLVKPKRRTRIKWRWRKRGEPKINPLRDAYEEEVVLRAARDYDGGWAFTPRSLHESQPGRFRSARALLKVIVRLHTQGRMERFHSRHSVKTIYRIKPEEEGHERTRPD